MKGRRVAHYAVIETIGRGGMGVVYLAEDLKLGRRVALKSLPEQLSSDESARERLQMEARAASSLNHPNICTIYGIEEDDRQHFIVMELLDGKTLEAAIGGHPLGVETLLKLASQVSSALGAAHRKGIVHRDLKPSNIFVTTSGDAKVMDFGLAKRTGPFESQADALTIASPVTTQGTLIGTAIYMSPEQLRALELDQRSDLFSFGLVLYEMATGRHPFGPGTPASVIDGIFNRAPVPPSTHHPLLPPRLDDVILRLLEKDRDLRYQDAADLEADLRRVARDTLLESTQSMSGVTSARPGPRPPASRPRMRVAVAVAAVAAALVAVAVWQWRAGADPSSPPSIANAIFSQLTDQPGAEMFPALSPDGKLVAYTVRSEDGDSIVVQRVGGEKPIRLADGSQPAFSPDGGHLAFHVDGANGGIFVMGSTGESIRRLSPFGFTPNWSPDGTEIVFDTEGTTKVNMRTSKSRLWRVAVSGGEPQAMTPEDGDAVQPRWSPNKKRIAYWSKESPTKAGIWTIPAAGGAAVKVTDTAAQSWCPAWSADGRYLYFLSNVSGTMSLWWVAIDEESGVPQGAPALLMASPNPLADLSISLDGRSLTYTQQLTMGTLQAIPLDPVTHAPNGKPSPVTRLTKGSFGMDVTRDGGWFAFASANRDLYVMRSDGSDHRQLTDGTVKLVLPRLSPDGKQIAFAGERGGVAGIWTMGFDGTGLKQVVPDPHGRLASPVWSPDGKRLAYADIPGGVFIQELGGPEAKRTPLFQPKAGEIILPFSWSRDGRKLGLTMARPDQTLSGVKVYSFDTGQVKDVTDTSAAPTFFNDSRYAISSDQWTGRVYVLDTETGQRSPLFATALNRLDAGALSSDNRTFYLVLTALESDVWLLTMPLAPAPAP